MMHLSDTEIQDYVDGNITDEQSEIIAHLGTCQLCMKKLRQYEVLSESLKTDFTPALSSNFADSVVTRIQTESEAVSRRSVRSVLIPLLGALGGLGALIMSVYLTPFLDSFAIDKLGGHVEKILLSVAEKLAGSINVDATMIVSVGLILLFVGIVDFMIRRHKHRHITFLV